MTALAPAAAPQSLVAERRLASLCRALGPALAEALADEAVVEVLVNADGRVRVDRVGRGIEATNTWLSVAERETAVRLLAAEARLTITGERPTLSATLPGSGARVQAMMPPIVAAPTLAIRKRPSVIFTLEDYLAAGIASADQAKALRAAVCARANIVVAGGTGSGKTTLLNALLAETEFAAARVVVLEDTAELQCVGADVVHLLTKRSDPPVTMRDLVQMTLRLRPDRIVVGEVRDGAALEVLKAWNTGHPGGLLTIHANSAPDALARLEDLCLEAGLIAPQRLIASAVDVVVFMSRTATGRRIEHVAPTRDGICALARAPP